MIDRFILETEQQGCANPKLVLTGGDAPFIADALGQSVVIEPNLVLIGLMLIANQTQNLSEL